MRLSKHWIKTACGLFLVTLLSITIFFDTWRSIVGTWYHSSSYNHGFVIAPISLWLCWSRRSNYLALCPAISWIALIAVVANGFLWLVADLVNIQVIKQFAVVGMLTSGFWTILGNRVTSNLLFPLGYLFFMVPVGSELIAPLMEFTATLSVYLIRLSGIPVFREGLNLTLTSGNWTVAEACSGINYLIASISLGVVYAYITFSNYWKRALFVLLAIIVPILANGIRAYLIVMLGHFSNMTLAVGVDHIIYGALFFGLVMMLLFYVGSFWRDPPLCQIQDVSNSRQGTVTMVANQAYFSALFLVGLLYLIWPVGSDWLSKTQQAPEINGLDHKTASSKMGWQPVQDPQWGWSPHFNGVSADSMVYFSNGQAVFGIYRASFGQESQGGAELVNSQNVLVTPEQRNTWKTIKAGTAQLMDNDDNPLSVDQTVLNGGKRNLVILRWYQIGTHHTANPYRAKWLQLIKRLSKDPSSELQVIMLIETPHDDFQQAQLVLQKIAQSWLTVK
ncbi:MAG: exosortase A [Methylovulum sp.]|nr:exosortase A [Methylovulum sp.]